MMRRHIARKRTHGARRLHIRAGDALILESPRVLTQAEVERIALTVRGIFPNNQAILLDHGIRLSVAHP